MSRKTHDEIYGKKALSECVRKISNRNQERVGCLGNGILQVREPAGTFLTELGGGTRHRSKTGLLLCLYTSNFVSAAARQRDRDAYSRLCVYVFFKGFFFYRIPLLLQKR